MNLFDYLDKYKDIPFASSPFNELDASIFALLAYPNYKAFKPLKKVVKAKKLLKCVENYDTDDLKEQSQKYIDLLKQVLSSSRYQGLKVASYKSHHDEDSVKQFQAITFLFKKMMIVSFSGTDGTLIGWKEDANMAYLDITPGEVEAEEYLKKIFKAHRYKKIVVVGHSKGGRFAVTAAKDFPKKEKLINVYSFDAPNNRDAFYDEEYAKIEPIVKRFAPEKSIVGRLISEPKNCQIVKSTRKFVFAHDILSWMIKNNHYDYANEYSPVYTKLVNVLNDGFKNYSNENKKELVDAVFQIAEHFSKKDDQLSKMDLVKISASLIFGYSEIVKGLIKALLEIMFVCL